MGNPLRFTAWTLFAICPPGVALFAFPVENFLAGLAAHVFERAKHFVALKTALVAHLTRGKRGGPDELYFPLFRPDDADGVVLVVEQIDQLETLS